MKKILMAFTISAMAGAGLYGLGAAASRSRQQLRSDQAAWVTQTQELAEVQEQIDALTTKIRELRQGLRSAGAASSADPALVDLLLSGDLKSAPLETQDKLLAELGRDRNGSGNYVLVSKAALANATLRPLKTFPEGHKLSEAVRGVLAITSEEQQTVEAAFAEALSAVGEWAKANLQREGPTGDMLVRYTIPADPTFEQALTNRLFSTIDAAIGNERGDLMRKFFAPGRLYEDGAIGERTNVLSIYRLSGQAGLGYRAGWLWENSEAINTFPEPIKPERFPYAFRFVFPGGWQEVAQRENLQLPDGFDQQR